ncbi:hypothetical protein BTVI_07735 [Pitangus sulphuratus]|nr:hypothetical protein BTVI_07735 [Pitangus sulphuratus]
MYPAQFGICKSVVSDSQHPRGLKELVDTIARQLMLSLKDHGHQERCLRTGRKKISPLQKGQEGRPRELLASQPQSLERDRYLLSKFADDINLGGVANTPGSCAALQKDLNVLERWAEKKQLNFNKGKSRVLHLKKNKPRHKGRLGDDLLGKQLCREGFRGPVGQQAVHDPELEVSNDKVECLWIKIRGKAIKADILVGVCYRPLNQDDDGQEESNIEDFFMCAQRRGPGTSYVPL